MTRSLRRIALVVLCATAVPGTVHSQDDGGGRSVFATGAGNRALGLGRAYAGVADDASAVLWNAGGLGRIQRSQFEATYASLYDLGINEQYASIVLPSWRWGVASITFRHFGVGDIEARDDRNVLLSDDLSDHESELVLGYGRPLGAAWGVGGAIKIQHQSLAGYSAGGIGLDLGVMVRPLLVLNPESRTGDRLSLGFAVRNALQPGIRLQNDVVDDPTGFRFGLAYSLPVWGRRPLLAAFDIEKTAGMNTRLHGGIELKGHPMLSLRTGIDDGSFTAGTGIYWKDVAFEYTIEENPLDRVQWVGASYSFGASVEESRRAALDVEENALQERLVRIYEEREKERVDQLIADAKTARAAGRFDEALEVLGVAVALRPNDTGITELKGTVLRDVAQELEAKSDYTAAALSYSQALALNPDDPSAQAGLARVRAKSDAVAERSAIVRRHFSNGLDAFGAHDLTRARAEFAAILAIVPDDEEAQAMHRRTLIAISLRTRDLLDQAQRMIDWGHLGEADVLIAEVETLEPNADGLRSAKTRLSRAKRQRSHSAGDDVQTVVQNGSTRDGSDTVELSENQRRELRQLYEKGMKATQHGDAAEAIRYWELVWAVDPHYERVGDHLKREYVMRGMEFFADGNFHRAVELWENALRIDPTDKKTIGYLSRAREQMARTREILGSEN